MKIRSPRVLRLLAFVASWLLRCWMATICCRVIQLNRQVHPCNPREGRFIYAFWHESILFPLMFRQKTRVLISQHADGELIAQTCGFLRTGVIRGSTTRGGTKALWDMVDCRDCAHFLVTPDGPRGPRRRVQLGLIFLASVSGLPIIPCGIGYRWAWRARSWDRFAVPLPFSSALGVAGREIRVPPNLSRKELEEYRQLVEAAMLDATASAERLSTGQVAEVESSRPLRASA